MGLSFLDAFHVRPSIRSRRSDDELGDGVRNVHSPSLLSQLHVSVLLVDERDNIPKLWHMQREQFLLALAKRIKDLRKRQGFSQEAFADHAGLHRVGFGSIEQCRRAPSILTVLKIAQGFGISLSELLKGVDRPVRRR
jgi:DNA-binding XRE family transcriptional regulator